LCRPKFEMCTSQLTSLERYRYVNLRGYPCKLPASSNTSLNKFPFAWNLKLQEAVILIAICCTCLSAINIGGSTVDARVCTGSSMVIYSFRKGRMMKINSMLVQGVTGGKVNILGGHSIGHTKQKKNVWPVLHGFRDKLFHCTVHCTGEQHVISSHELQSALMLTVEFSKMYYTR
jgi:hypothetical protein